MVVMTLHDKRSIIRCWIVVYMLIDARAFSVDSGLLVLCITFMCIVSRWRLISIQDVKQQINRCDYIMISLNVFTALHCVS